MKNIFKAVLIFALIPFGLKVFALTPQVDLSTTIRNFDKPLETFVFKNTPATKVVNALNEAAHCNLVCGNDIDGHDFVWSGNFKNTTPRQILDALCYQKGWRVEAHDGFAVVWRVSTKNLTLDLPNSSPLWSEVGESLQKLAQPGEHISVNSLAGLIHISGSTLTISLAEKYLADIAKSVVNETVRVRFWDENHHETRRAELRLISDGSLAYTQAGTTTTEARNGVQFYGLNIQTKIRDGRGDITISQTSLGGSPSDGHLHASFLATPGREITIGKVGSTLVTVEVDSLSLTPTQASFKTGS